MTEESFVPFVSLWFSSTIIILQIVQMNNTINIR